MFFSFLSLYFRVGSPHWYFMRAIRIVAHNVLESLNVWQDRTFTSANPWSYMHAVAPFVGTRLLFNRSDCLISTIPDRNIFFRFCWIGVAVASLEIWNWATGFEVQFEVMRKVGCCFVLWPRHRGDWTRLFRYLFGSDTFCESKPLFFFDSPPHRT